MNIKVCDIGVEYIEIKNTYTYTELVSIFKELDFLLAMDSLHAPEDTGSAYAPSNPDEEKAFLKQSKGVFLDNLYMSRDFSPLLTFNRKLYNIWPEIQNQCRNPVFRSLHEVDKDSTLVNYYENTDYYKPHRDHSVLTAMTYLYREPKAFDGGDLHLPEYNITLPCEFNTTYIIIGAVEHESTPVVLDKHSQDKGLGKFSINNFMSYS